MTAAIANRAPARRRLRGGRGNVGLLVVVMLLVMLTAH
jgi:hypothetical protein